MPLPTVKTKPKTSLEDQIILIYGPPKIGKSTFASKFSSPLFLATEAGLNNLEVYQMPIDTWEAFDEAYKELKAGKNDFRTVVIDTVDNLYRACQVYVRNKHGIAHESDLDWGKGWSLVKDAFTHAITKLSLLPYGLLMISHSDNVEIKTRTAVINKSIPTLPKAAREIVLGLADIILFCDSQQTDEGEVRIIHADPSENWEAGDRTGKLPPVLPLDYAAFMGALSNGNGKGSGNGKEAK